MFDHMTGSISDVKEKAIVLTVADIGFLINTPSARALSANTSGKFYLYFHWNSEQGPSLYGFLTELERKVFLMIIDCPKIGPSIGLSILSQLSAPQFLEIITTSNEAGLSALNGIGPKKAEQIIVELKHKVQKLLNAGDLVIEQQQNFVVWQQLSEVLSSLNYTKQEITKVIQHLTEKYTGQNQPLDFLIRSALAVLASKQL